MSQENIELVRRFYEDGWLDRDLGRVIELATSDVEYVNPSYAIEPGVRKGPEAVERAMRAFGEVWDESRHELHELYDCGDVVVASVTWYTLSRGSAQELVQHEAHSWTIRDGRFARLEWGTDLERALECARSPG